MFYKIIVSITLILVSITNAAALTDPEPNPFYNLQQGERVLDATVTGVTDGILTAKRDNGEEFSGSFGQIYKYRDGGGPAAANEFAPGDRLRVLVDSTGLILAAQNYNLLLCNQQFYGWIRYPAKDYFTLRTAGRDKYKVWAGWKTEYRDEKNRKVLDYTPVDNDVVRVHGVVNTNSKQIFTETFGAYIMLLGDKEIQALYELRETELLKQKFSDTVAKHDYFAAVQYLEYEGLVNGYADGSFKPGQPINRAEFTKIIMLGAFPNDVPAKVATKCFPDFEAAEWFSVFVCLAKDKNVVSGYGDGLFRPANNVNLAEALKIITLGYELSPREAKSGEQWYLRFYEKAKELKILPENLTQFDAPLTRGQMAELIMRTLKYKRGELEDYLLLEGA